MDAADGWTGPYLSGENDMSAEVATDAWQNAYTYVADPAIAGATVADFLVISRGADKTLDRVRADTYDATVAAAALPMDVRGYEDIKLERAATFRTELAAALRDA